MCFRRNFICPLGYFQNFLQNYLSYILIQWTSNHGLSFSLVFTSYNFFLLSPVHVKLSPSFFFRHCNVHFVFFSHRIKLVQNDQPRIDLVLLKEMFCWNQMFLLDLNTSIGLNVPSLWNTILMLSSWCALSTQINLKSLAWLVTWHTSAQICRRIF